MPSHFHSAEKSARSSAAQSLVLQRVRQHQRPEHRRVADIGLGRAPFEPGEQRLVGRRERVPDLLDVVDLEPAISATAVLASRADTPTRNAPGQQLEQRPPSGRVRARRASFPAAAPARCDRSGPARRRCRTRRGGHPAQFPLPGLRGGVSGGGSRVLGVCHRPSPLPARGSATSRKGERADPTSARSSPPCRRRSRATGETALGPSPCHHVGERAPQRKRERQPVGQRRQRPAAIGIGRGAEIVDDQPQLGVAARACRTAGRAGRRRPSFALLLLEADQRQRPRRACPSGRPDAPARPRGRA